MPHSADHPATNASQYPAGGIAPQVAGAAQRFRADLDQPQAVQAQVLQSILAQNRDSEFGRTHRFADMGDAASYAAQVPVTGYDGLAPFIDRMARGESRVLVSQNPVAFEQTGGSSDAGKLIPYTAAGLAAFQSGLLPWLDDLCVHFPQMGQGLFYWAISPACRAASCTPGGVPIGLPDAAYLGADLGSVVAALLAVPAAVGALSDVGQWRSATLRNLFACEGLSMVSVWSPSFFTELLRHARAGCDALAQSIAQTAPHRARLILQVLRQERPDYRLLWPRLQVISCWDQASASAGAAALRAAFPHVLVQGKGLLATEGLVSIPLLGFDWPVLALRAGYFEFVDAHGTAWGAEAVAEGQEYQVLLTTHSGLYRYALGDQVLVRGFAGRTPLLEFVGRSYGTSDLCGEKLCDAFVARRITALGQTFAMLAPDAATLDTALTDTTVPHNATPGSAPPPGAPYATARYALLLDAEAVAPQEARAIAAALDQALHDNPQYAYARQIGQLGAVTPVRCHQPLQGWLQARMAQGQRLGDIKLPALLTGAQWKDWVQPV